MSSKTSTNSSIQYDPGSQSAYNALQPGIQSNLQNDMQLDPRNSMTFNFGLAAAQNAARQLAGRNTQNFFGNMTASGINPSSGYIQSQLAKLDRQGASGQANAFIQNFMNYDLMRRQATAQAQGYRPLQTGQATTQSTSGLGTWLPQAASAGIGLAGGLIPKSGGAINVASEATPNGTGQFGNFTGGLGSFGMGGGTPLPQFAGVTMPTLYHPDYFSDGHGPY